ncbi:hypothetical protein BCD67_00735 [Oscillatoriales cyanobacterium USR001]|nr:hypothetical protein BCD67_00735 [Oscillatoriales cyanobacterium USR001]
MYPQKSTITKIILIIAIASTGLLFLKKDTSIQAQTQSPTPKPTPQEIVVNNEVRSLPGSLDNVPLFNSDSPEWVKKEGILLSTFPPDGKKNPNAHLNFPFQGKFNLFAHHFTHTPPNLRTLYIGAILYNPGKQPITVEILQAASYLMEPDAPFQQKPPLSENPQGEVYSGHGIRAVDNVLRGIRQPTFPAQLVIKPGESKMLLNGAIPVRDLPKPINGRSTFISLNSSSQVYAATLAMYAKKNPDGSDRAPTLQEWQDLLYNGNLALPRDKTPTPPGATGNLIYSRVAGVQQGSTWRSQLVDKDSSNLTIPPTGKAYSYTIATLRGGKLGTEQVQTAKLLVRYPDTAYEAHGNYGVHYDLTLPLHNTSDRTKAIAITLETPLKDDKLTKGGLRFRQPPLDFPYFRGTIRLRYKDDSGQNLTRYVHLWHRVGQILEPTIKLKLVAGEKRLVRVDFIYPPDSTPPQVLTLRTLD